MELPTKLIENSSIANSSFDDGFKEEIGTNKHDDALQSRQDVLPRGLTKNAPSTASNKSNAPINHTSSQSGTVNQSTYGKKESESTTARHHADGPAKPLSFNGAALHELQTKRMENREKLERQKLLQNQLRTIPPTRTREIESFFTPSIMTSRLAKDSRRRGEVGVHTTTALPSVKDDTKRKLLMLNQRYDSSHIYTEGISRARLVKNYEAHHKNEAQVMKMQTKQCVSDDDSLAENQTSPFKLIMHGIQSHGTIYQTSHVVTPDDKQESATSCDGNYLFQLTQLAQGSASLREADDESSSKQSSCLSCTTPAPHYQADSVCNSQASDEGNICSSYSESRREIAGIKMIPHTSEKKIGLTHALQTLLQNKRLRHTCNFMKHVIIVFGLALLFAWVDLAKEKIMHWLHSSVRSIFSLLADRVQCIRDSAIRWLRSNMQFVISVVHDWFQSTQVTLAQCYHNTLQLVVTSLSVRKEVVRHRMSLWNQYFIQEILPLTSSITHKISHYIRLAKELLLGTTSADNHRICDMVQLSHIKLFLRTKQASKLMWHRLDMLYYDFAESIDLTSAILQTWFLIGKLQLNCSLAFSDIIQKIADMIETASIILNSTVEFVSSEWQELASQSMAGNGSQIILTKSTITTVPVQFDSTHIDFWHNLTRFDKAIVASDAVIFRDTSSLCLSAFSHRHNLERSWNTQKLHSFGLDRASNVFLHNYQNRPSMLQNKLQKNSDSLLLPIHLQNESHLSSKDEARRHYDASFPTFPAVIGADKDRDGFDSVNLMEMASEATKRLISKRRKDKLK